MFLLYIFYDHNPLSRPYLTDIFGYSAKIVAESFFIFSAILSDSNVILAACRFVTKFQVKFISDDNHII